MKSKTTILLSLTLLIFLSSFLLIKRYELNNNDKVLDILAKLGDKKPLHYIPFNKLDLEKVKKGKEIITLGYTINQKGKKTKKQSKHFVCTDCHNIKIEDPNLTQSNPDTRLNYAIKNNLKFLPATTLAGVVNREHWYNDDYVKKYGNLVTPANDTLTNAIHLCAVQCSQGRALKKWEMEAVTQYFINIGFEINDLKLTSSETSSINTALNSGKNTKKAITLIKSKYLNYSPATFIKPTPKSKRELGKNGDIENGKQIFQLSCLSCHNQLGVTNYKLNKQSLTFKHLKKWAKTNAHFSIYQITRKGTYAMPGYKPYMPNYTKERLSNNQLEDLMAYINSKVKK